MDIIKSTLRRTALPLAALLLLPACATKTINHIMAEPNRYANHEVGIKGEVMKSVSLLGHGAYMVDDGTGSIWVVSKHGVPRQGARVKVTGRVKDVVDVGSIVKLPEEVSSGLVMMETKHKAHD